MRGRALKNRMEQRSTRRGRRTIDGDQTTTPGAEAIREAPGGNDDPVEGARSGERPLAPATGPAGSDNPVEGPRT